MKIVIPGGSGQVGAILGRAFQREGHEVVVLSRRPIDSPWRVVGTTRRLFRISSVSVCMKTAPGRLLDRGFVFNYPIWQEAAADLCARWHH